MCNLKNINDKNTLNQAIETVKMNGKKRMEIDNFFSFLINKITSSS